MHAMARPRFSSALRERNLERAHTRVGDVWVGVGILDGNYQTTVSEQDMQPAEESQGDDEMPRDTGREASTTPRDVTCEVVKDCEGLSNISHNVLLPASQTLSAIIENPSQDFTLHTTTSQNTQNNHNNQANALTESFISRRVRELEATGMGSDEAIRQAIREQDHMRKNGGGQHHD